MYTCPMHPEIRLDRPGDCPKCGMDLEAVGWIDVEGQEHKLLQSLSRKFWIGLIFTVPIIFLTMGEMIPAINLSSFIPYTISSWSQLLLASVVIFWSGGFLFRRAWDSLINQSLNMFTLIALGVGAAYVYSATAVLLPQIFPESLKTKGKVSLYFEA
ncbi:MAG: heavy metal-binding domain-containing protein [Candidatus Omnitrophota bacterium]|nr:heavy metal-binding domain-containing protein [Candidatus Omnitrophota bacterium]